MKIKTSSTAPLEYTMVITGDELRKLACALSHALRYEKAMEYPDDWTKRIKAMKEILNEYDPMEV